MEEKKLVRRILHTVRKFTGRINVRFYFIFLVIALFVVNDVRLITEIYEKGSNSFISCILTYVVAFFSVITLLLNRSTPVRKFAQILVFTAIYTDILYLILGNYPFSYPDAINLFNNPEYASGAIATFIVAFIAAFAGAAVIFAILQLLIKNFGFLFSPVWLVPFIIIQVVFLTDLGKNVASPDFFPSTYRVTGNLLTANKSRPEKHWRRTSVTEQPGKRKVEHLFLIDDESVTGDALSVNGFAQPTTPYLKTNADRFINFGIATSFTNFSAGSNLALMSGIQMSDLPDKNYISFLKPGIFQFAKKAGYKTFLLDAQPSEHTLQNYTAARDLAFIDSLHQPGVIYPAAASYSRDSILAQKIAEIARLDTPTFVYVNKMGTHWPYHTNFPGDSLRNYFTGVRSESIADYFKSIFWNVNKFWERLSDVLPGNKNLLIVYTSDHGENYTSESFKIKHASIYGTALSEGLVPLFVLDKAHFFPEKFSPPTNRFSHANIFPTLLSGMGYSSLFINTNYGKTLLEMPDSAPRWFQTGDLFGRGKNKRIYVK